MFLFATLATTTTTTTLMSGDGFKHGSYFFPGLATTTGYGVGFRACQLFPARSAGSPRDPILRPSVPVPFAPAVACLHVVSFSVLFSILSLSDVRSV